MQKLEKLMDAKDDSELPQLLSLSRGPNPYLDKERCLLCGCERNEVPDPLSFGDTGINLNLRTWMTIAYYGNI